MNNGPSFPFHSELRKRQACAKAISINASGLEKIIATDGKVDNAPLLACPKSVADLLNLEL